jgi:hypothetical protein
LIAVLERLKTGCVNFHHASNCSVYPSISRRRQDEGWVTKHECQKTKVKRSLHWCPNGHPDYGIGEGEGEVDEAEICAGFPYSDVAEMQCRP